MIVTLELVSYPSFKTSGAPMHTRTCPSVHRHPLTKVPHARRGRHEFRELGEPNCTWGACELAPCDGASATEVQSARRRGRGDGESGTNKNEPEHGGGMRKPLWEWTTALDLLVFGA